MSDSEARNFANNLPPLSLDGKSLQETLDQLKYAITDSLRRIEKSSSATGHDNLTLQQAISVVLDPESVEDESGAVEVLYGRAGLLWTVLNLRQLFDNVDADVSDMPQLRSLGSLVDVQVARELDGLIATGKRGKSYLKSNTEKMECRSCGSGMANIT